MYLAFSPMRSDSQLTVARDGDVLVVNDMRLDFTGVTEDAPLDTADIGCEWLVGPVARHDGVLHIALILPHGMNAPKETLYPEPIAVSGNGPITLPPYASFAAKPGEQEPS
ncbi:MAG: hypothetical protein RQ750_02520 [Roseovarius sp.]|nr:hypothetical protein [Roseovarius sp.]